MIPPRRARRRAAGRPEAAAGGHSAAPGAPPPGGASPGRRAHRLAVGAEGGVRVRCHEEGGDDEDELHHLFQRSGVAAVGDAQRFLDSVYEPFETDRF